MESGACVHRAGRVCRGLLVADRNDPEIIGRRIGTAVLPDDVQRAAVGRDVGEELVPPGLDVDPRGSRPGASVVGLDEVDRSLATHSWLDRTERGAGRNLTARDRWVVHDVRGIGRACGRWIGGDPYLGIRSEEDVAALADKRTVAAGAGKLARLRTGTGAWSQVGRHAGVEERLAERSGRARMVDQIPTDELGDLARLAEALAAVGRLGIDDGVVLELSRLGPEFELSPGHVDGTIAGHRDVAELAAVHRFRDLLGPEGLPAVARPGKPYPVVRATRREAGPADVDVAGVRAVCASVHLELDLVLEVTHEDWARRAARDQRRELVGR